MSDKGTNPKRLFVVPALLSIVFTIAIAAYFLRILQGKPKVSFEERVLAIIPHEYEQPKDGWNIIFSPDGRKVAYRAKQGSRWFIVISDKKGEEFDQIGQPIFNRDGTKVAYVARQASGLTGKDFVVLNDKRGQEFERILSPSPVFSPDGSKIAYEAVQGGHYEIFKVKPGKLKIFAGGKHFIVVDDKKGPEFDYVGRPVFSPDGSKIAYQASEGGKYFIMIGDKRGPEYDYVGQPAFNSEGTKVAYRAQQGDRNFMMLGDHKGSEFDQVGWPAFSPDGSNIAYWASRAGKEFIVVGDKKHKEFDRVGWPAFILVKAHWGSVSFL